MWFVKFCPFVLGTDIIIYRLDGLGFKSRNGQEIFSSTKPSRCTQVHTPPPVQWVPIFFLGNKASGAWIWLLTSTNAEVKNELTRTSAAPVGLHGVTGRTLLLFYFYLVRLSCTRNFCNKWTDFVNLDTDGVASEGSTHVNIIDAYTTALPTCESGASLMSHNPRPGNLYGKSTINGYILRGISFS
jgi:hypothetical protein